MASQWPLVVNALVATLPTLSGWSSVSVFDGPPVTSDVPSQFCTVGFVPPDGEQAGTFQVELSEVGNVFDAETGEVLLTLVVGSGDGDSLSAHRTTAFALVDALRDWVRATPTLGVLPVGSISSLSADLTSAQNAQGSAFGVLLTVLYAVPVTT